MIRTILQSQTTAKVASNTLFQLAGKVISMGITVLVTVIVTRIYGREGYGAFNLMQIYPALFFIIVDFGFNAIATRELSVDWSKARLYFSNILILRLLFSAVFTVCLVIALLFFPYDYELRLGIYLNLLLIFTQALYATTNIIFQVKLRYDLSFIGYVIGSLFILVLTLITSYMRVDIMWVSFSYVVGGIVTFLLNLYFVKRFLPDLRITNLLDGNLALCKTLTLSALPLGLMFIFSQINFKADSILMSVLPLPNGLNLNNTEAVGVYGLPYKVFEVSLVLPTFVMNSVYPIFVRHNLISKAKFKSTFFVTLGVLLFGGLVVGFVGALFAPLIINILGGSEFVQSTRVLQILLLGVSLFYVTQPISWLLVTLGKQSYLPYVYMVSAVFNVIANLSFIPRYAFYASAVITIVSESINLLLLVLFAIKVWHEKYS